jgi:hypothetical protein
VPVRTEEIPGAPGTYWVRDVLLNGVCVDPRGEVYLTGTGIDITLGFDLASTSSDIVYRFDGGVPVAIASGAELMGCVGVGASSSVFERMIFRMSTGGS